MEWMPERKRIFASSNWCWGIELQTDGMLFICNQVEWTQSADIAGKQFLPFIPSVSVMYQNQLDIGYNVCILSSLIPENQKKWIKL